MTRRYTPFAMSCSRRRFLQGLSATAIAAVTTSACGDALSTHIATLTATPSVTVPPTATPTPTPDPQAAAFATQLETLAPEVQSYLKNDPRFQHPGSPEVHLARFLAAASAGDTVGMFDSPTSNDPASRGGRDLIPWDVAHQIRMLETGAFRSVRFGSRPGLVGVTSFLVPDLDASFSQRILDIAEHRTEAIFRVVGDLSPHEDYVSVQYEPFPGATSFAWGMSFVLDDDLFEQRDGDASVDHVFCHEFTHCLQFTALARAPVWFAEGSADYVAATARAAEIPRPAGGYVSAADGAKVTLNLTGSQTTRQSYLREAGNGYRFLSDLGVALGAEWMSVALRDTFSSPNTGSQIVATFQDVANRAGVAQGEAVRDLITKWT